MWCICLDLAKTSIHVSRDVSLISVGYLSMLLAWFACGAHDYQAVYFM